MITEKTVFETADGKQFATQEEAELYQLHEEIKDAIGEGYCGPEFEIDGAFAALLRAFNVTRKGEAK